MHRHGYVGRKFGRENDQRHALLKGLLTSLVMNGRVETTLPKAKELVRHIEKLITKAKKGGLNNRRLVIAALDTEVANIKTEIENIALSDRDGDGNTTNEAAIVTLITSILGKI